MISEKDREHLESIIVSAAQMQAIETAIFAARMPIASLMEKAALLTAQRIQEIYPPCLVGILVGPGHNGGDALVIARELYLQGYEVMVYAPFPRLKDLTAQHANYVQSLGIPWVEDISFLSSCELIIDGLFGFGLTRDLEGEVKEAIALVNQWRKPVISIDIPSGIHTDTGAVLGEAIVAEYSFCLGLWKLAYFQDQALPYLGKVERIDFGIPPKTVATVLNQSPITIKQFTKHQARESFPLPKPVVTHKYQQGHLLLICGSQRYAGGAILTALGARASGVGMLSVAVPKSLKPLLVSHLPEALIIECPETPTGAIAQLPPLDLTRFQAIACGPGLTTEPTSLIDQILATPVPLILDADALNIIAEKNPSQILPQRQTTTILTPHLGEFKRLFPLEGDRLNALLTATQQTSAIILLKGSRTLIAQGQQIYAIPESTPALARGGSGDVLTGLMGGLIAQNHNKIDIFTKVTLAAWWHAQAALLAVSERSELGVDAYTLTQYLIRLLAPSQGKG